MVSARPASVALRVVGIFILALCALWFVLRNAAIGFLSQASPQLALRFPPPSGVAIANSIMVETRPLPDAVVRARLRQALARAPLSDAPFVAAAWHARLEGRLAAASRHMALARERNRPAPSRQMLSLVVNIQQGRWAEAIDQIKLLGRQKRAAPVMTKVLLVLPRDPKAKAVLVAKLKEDPDWARKFLRDARKSGAHPELLAELKAAIS